jgi:hypothetical protein
MEEFPTIDEVVDEIVGALEWPGYDLKSGIKIADWLRAIKWPNWVELIDETSGIKVQREFGNFSEADQELLANWERKIKKYIRTYTLRTIQKAVKACIFRIFQLEEQGVVNYTDARVL